MSDLSVVAMSLSIRRIISGKPNLFRGSIKPHFALFSQWGQNLVGSWGKSAVIYCCGNILHSVDIFEKSSALKV